MFYLCLFGLIIMGARLDLQPDMPVTNMWFYVEQSGVAVIFGYGGIMNLASGVCSDGFADWAGHDCFTGEWLLDVAERILNEPVKVRRCVLNKRQNADYFSKRFQI